MHVEVPRHKDAFYSQDYQGKVLAEGKSIKAEIRRRNTVVRQQGEVTQVFSCGFVAPQIAM